MDSKGQIIFDLLLSKDVEKRPESAEAAAEVLFGDTPLGKLSECAEKIKQKYDREHPCPWCSFNKNRKQIVPKEVEAAEEHKLEEKKGHQIHALSDR